MDLNVFYLLLLYLLYFSSLECGSIENEMKLILNKSKGFFREFNCRSAEVVVGKVLEVVSIIKC